MSSKPASMKDFNYFRGWLIAHNPLELYTFKFFETDVGQKDPVTRERNHITGEIG